MTFSRPGLVAAALFVAAGACPASMQAQAVAVLRGKVLNDANDKPVPGAEVAIPALRISTTSDSVGSFRLLHIAAGKQIVWVRRVGFAGASTVLTFATNDTVEADFALVQSAATLPEVAVSAPSSGPGKLREFDRRRAAGLGNFLTPDDLAKQANRRLSEVLRAFPGLEIVHGASGSAESYVSAGRSSQGVSGIKASQGVQACPVAINIDGGFVYRGNRGEAMFNINSIDVSTLSGVEYYPSAAEIPPEFNGTRAACGLLVLWTK
jgi:hypothetical protein